MEENQREICGIKGRKKKNNQIIHKREITTKQLKTELTKSGGGREQTNHNRVNKAR
jgi:hypothetical protein